MWCDEQLGKLQELVSTLHPDDVQLLAISTDSLEDSKKMVQIVKELTGLDLTFPLLADTEHKVIDRYGLLNMGTAPGPKTRRFSNPATFILDPKGIVRWRMVEENWKIRPTNELILAALERVKRGEDTSLLTLDSIAATAVPEEAAPRARVRGRVSDPMVLIPAGPFLMGEKGRFSMDSPSHEVDLDAYYIDTYEVTNRKYRLFLEDIAKTGDHSRCHPAEPPHKDHTPKYWSDARYNQEEFPVVGVDWFDAYAYAAWAGKQLPTEAQWEKAARGPSTARGTEAAQDDTVDEQKANLNAEAGADAATEADQGKVLPQHAHGPKPVGSYKANEYGLLDVRGNVEEWSRDWYGPDYYRRSPRKNPAGPPSGVFQAVRGGSWHHGSGRPWTRYTHPPSVREAFLGFRCVRPARP